MHIDKASRYSVEIAGKGRQTEQVLARDTVMSIMLPWLPPQPVGFPPLENALDDPDGLLAAGGALTPAWLLAAYRHGIFPWYSGDQPILWWSPDPRLVLFPAEIHVRRSLAKRLRNAGFTVTFDQDFAAVIAACAMVRAAAEGTWITSPMQAAYTRLHQMGYAHSIEVWRNGRLIGGLYGVAIGRMFYGESMFSHERDASKVALVHLARHLQSQGGGLIDCQMHTPHLVSLGARDIARNEFINYLKHYISQSATDWDMATSISDQETESREQ